MRDDLVDRIVGATDIVELVSSRLPLKKAGRNFKANCPFHGEKTPSFIVSPDKQIFHCFGCGAGGNAISFLMKYERMSFPETVEYLAEKAHVKLPAGRFSEPARDGLSEKLIGINEAAKEFYGAVLRSEDGRLSMRYLKDRGISDDAIKQFGIGYAPNAWDGLLSYLGRKGISPDALEKAGLALAREKSEGYYDRFRNRIIFPIHDMRGRVLAFGARALDDSQPKYINSPETPVYVKGRNLYGLNESKGHMRDTGYAVIVEGYLDFIMPFQHGIKNIVATLGTALTPDQIRLIKRFSKTAVIVFDSDKAGEEASLRGLDVLVSGDMNVRIATLPKGYDPDKFVRERGAEDFGQIVKSSKDLFAYKMALLSRKFNKEGVRGRAAIATLMLPTIARIPNEILKASFLKKLSQDLSLDEDALRSELRKVKADYSYEVPVVAQAPARCEPRNAEVLLLGIVLDDAGALDVVERELGFDQFRDESVKEVMAAVIDARGSGEKVSPGRLISF
ncbi:MAG: DNA primase, partial [Candidatus Omnitrophota bacterium]